MSLPSDEEPMRADPIDPTDMPQVDWVTRTRLVEWVDPVAVRALRADLTGLEILRAIRDGRVPDSPMAQLLGMRCVVAEPGEVVMELRADEFLENGIGILHGGVAMALLDTAMGTAAHTVLPLDQVAVTLDFKLTFLRPLHGRSGVVQAKAKVLNQGRRNIFVEGRLDDARGRLAVHAVGNFTVVGTARDGADLEAVPEADPRTT